MSVVQTQIHLPPGPLSPDVSRQVVEILFGSDPAFVPGKYGRVDGDTPVGDTPMETILDFLVKKGRLTVTGKPSSQYILIMPNRENESSWHGSITWNAPLRGINQKWYGAHARKTAGLMRATGSPLAYASVKEDVQGKCWKWVSDGSGGEVKRPTIAVPEEGIPGMFWRLFVDQRFASLMQLDDVDPASIEHPEESITMLLPYRDPQEAGSEHAQKAEKKLLSKIGSGLFYDHQAGRPPTRVPQLLT